MKKSIVALLGAFFLFANTALALDSATELMNLGMSPELAKKLVTIVNTLASPFPNNTFVTFRNAANSGNINAIKVDGTDDLTITSDTGDVIKLQIAGTTEATLDDDKLTFSGASFKFVPGATSLLFRNNADSSTNLTISDAGLVTARAGVTATTGDITATAGNVIMSTSGNTLQLQEATAGAKCMGTLTANGATPVVTSTTCATTASRIFLSRTSAETGSVEAWISAISNGVSFSITSEAADTGTYNWFIINEAA